MTDSTDELMKSYEVIRSIVMRHSQYDAARILTLNLATCITTNSRQDETRMGEGALQPHRACSMAKNLWARPMAQLLLREVDEELPAGARHDQFEASNFLARVAPDRPDERSQLG